MTENLRKQVLRWLPYIRYKLEEGWREKTADGIVSLAEQHALEERFNDYLFMADALMDRRINADDALQEWKSKLNKQRGAK